MSASTENRRDLEFASPEGRTLRIERDFARWSWTLTVLQDGDALAHDFYQRYLEWADLCKLTLGQEHRSPSAAGDLVLRKVGERLAMWLETEDQPHYLAADGLIGLVPWSECIEAIHELERARAGERPRAEGLNISAPASAN